MKNWKTSVLGIGAGLPQIISGIVNSDWSQVGAGIATILAFFFAKDNNVSGT